jgi:iron complex outermembrane receptor protein
MALRHDIEILPAAVLVALFGLLATSLAWSQSAPDRTAATAADSGALAEVVVTAQYRAEPLQQTPIAITAVTADDIEQRGFTNSSDIAYAVPNASFRPAQAAFGKTQTAYIRGVGQNDFNFAF